MKNQLNNIKERRKMKPLRHYYVSVCPRIDFRFSDKGYYYCLSNEPPDTKRYKDWAKFTKEREFELYQLSEEERQFPKRLMNFIDNNFPQNNRPDFYYYITF